MKHAIRSGLRRCTALLLAACVLLACFPAFSVNAEASTLFLEESFWDMISNYFKPVRRFFDFSDHYGEYITREEADKEDKFEMLVPAVVSLGDSFSAGEGNEPYYGSELPVLERIRNEDWLSHRSKAAWPGRLKIPDINGPLNLYKEGEIPQWFFVAISGAVAANLSQRTYNKDVYQKITNKDDIDVLNQILKKDGKLEPKLDYGVWTTATVKNKDGGIIISSASPYDGEKLFNKTKYYAKVYNDIPTELSVINTIRSIETEQEIQYGIEYVTMSMGGNDVGFAEVVEKAVLDFIDVPSYLQLLKDKLDLYDIELEPALLREYEKIFDTFGENIHLIIAGYPKLFCAEDMFLMDLMIIPQISRAEAKRANDAADELDRKLKRTISKFAARHPQYMDNIHYVSVIGKFNGHGAYAKKQTPYIADIWLPREEDLQNTFSKMERDEEGINFVTAASVHPNEAGLQAYAAVVQAEIDRIEEESANIELRVFAQDEDEKYHDEISVVIENQYGRKMVLEPDKYDSDPCFMLKVKPGKYKITLTMPGIKAMEIVRDIDEDHTAFTFEVPGDIHTPEETVKKMEEALNAWDTEMLMECFDDSMNSIYDSFPLGGLGDLAGGMRPFMKELGFEVHYDVKIDKVVYSEDGENCVVYLNIKTTFSGDSSTEQMELPMHLVGNKWLIGMEGIEKMADLLA